ncbi:Uncharacterized protein FWK35_00029064, partial [Aphis craccivora]
SWISEQTVNVSNIFFENIPFYLYCTVHIEPQKKAHILADTSDVFDLRLLVNGYLEHQGKKVKKFKNGTMPGRDWADSFLIRHKNILAVVMCQNIKRSREGVSRKRVTNSSKTSNSIMFTGTADGILLAPFTVYKAKTITDSWRLGGPKGSRYASVVVIWGLWLHFSRGNEKSLRESGPLVV